VEGRDPYYGRLGPMRHSSATAPSSPTERSFDRPGISIEFHLIVAPYREGHPSAPPRPLPRAATCVMHAPPPEYCAYSPGVPQRVDFSEKYATWHMRSPKNWPPGRGHRPPFGVLCGGTREATHGNRGIHPQARRRELGIDSRNQMCRVNKKGDF
jgi:hypothetical protein